MTDDVLELDADPRPPDASRRRVQTWSRGRTVVVALLVLALAVGMAAVLRPKPPPVPEVVGLQGGPTEAWRADAAEIAYARAMTSSSSDLVTLSLASPDPENPDSENPEVTVAMRDVATGELRWSTTLPCDRGGHSWLYPLGGSEWVAMVTPGAALLLDRATGQVDGRLPLPDFPEVQIQGDGDEPFTITAGTAWVASSEDGTLFTGANHHQVIPLEAGSAEVLDMGAELTAYSATDLANPLWIAQSDEPLFAPTQPASAVLMGETVVVSSLGKTFAVDIATGEHSWELVNEQGDPHVTQGPLPRPARLGRDPSAGHAHWQGPLAGANGGPGGTRAGPAWCSDVLRRRPSGAAPRQ